ncbi:unnamed protein product [Phytophthora lilii]|uniref:Unnamed protein product n=1 Tax=Phytophthora lilii TaxID=2077276 RepID=A0A9W6TXE6_9STRA|nr:unnamed protein product [Phytophthora lilii]
MIQLSFKSKYASIEEMLNDSSYCLRLMKLSWFQKRTEYPIVREKFGHYGCGDVLKVGEEVEYYNPCDRMWCRPDKSCCYKTSIKYECATCGYFEIRNQEMGRQLPRQGKEPERTPSIYWSFSKSSNRKLLAKTYKLPEARVERNLNKNYKQPPAYSFTKSNVRETHHYEYTQTGRSLTRFGQRLRARRMLSRFRFSLDTSILTVSLGKVMDESQSQDFASKISYPSSSYQLKEITMVRVNIIYCDHTLGKNIPIPDSIRTNRFIVDFPNTNNKCMFYCIAYHFEDQTQDLKKRTVSLVKSRVKQYCEYKCFECSAKFFKDMEPIDILAFDELEDCFNSRSMSISRRWRFL